MHVKDVKLLKCRLIITAHRGIKKFMIPFMTHLIMEDMEVAHETCGEKNIESNLSNSRILIPS